MYRVAPDTPSNLRTGAILLYEAYSYYSTEGATANNSRLCHFVVDVPR